MLWQNRFHLIWVVGVLLSVPATAQERGRPNHLDGEQSPYLQAHSRQPVDWYPWGEPAFEKAREEGKPVFLSVGFATCHWCHLMARESFSDPVVAEFLNRNFVSVKVDREERPDVDQAYMGFLQASTGKFGWPLTVFLTPERQPFFAGGYWERDALLRQLRKIDSEWRKDPAAVERAAGKVSSLLKDLYAPGSRATGPVEPDGLEEAYRWYYSAFDAANGGFGGAPKYPAPDAYGFLLRYHLISGKQGPLHIVRTSLEKLASSALYDPVGGGFHRYCEDRRWQVPHFEKLLFLEAQLVVSYTELFQLTGEPRLERVVRETLDYLLGELQSPDGGFFSSQDAAGPCREDPQRSCLGAPYVWSEAELREVLGDDFPLLASYFGVTREGNLADAGGAEYRGWNVLRASEGLAAVAQRLGEGPKAAQEGLERGLGRLRQVRRRRPPPALDDKVLAGWNGLAISALSRAYQVFGDARYLRAAERAADRLLTTLADAATGRLHRRVRQGVVSQEGFVDDYALVVQGLLDLYETDLDARWGLAALRWNRRQIELFWDPVDGGFFNAEEANPVTGSRMKELYDGVDPSPNGVSALNLLRLSQLTHDPDLERRVDALAKAFASRLARSPRAMPQLRAALAYRQAEPLQIIIAGDRQDAGTLRMAAEVHRRFLPFKVLLLADGGGLQRELEPRLEMLAAVRRLEQKATAYVCRQYQCEFPTNDPIRLGEILDAAEKARPKR